MKTLINILIIAAVCIGLMLPAICDAKKTGPAVQSKSVTVDDRWQITVKLYNGRECDSAKVVVSVRDKMHNKDWDGSSVSCNTIVTIKWQDPSGSERRERIDIPSDIDHGGSREYSVCLDNTEEEGTGNISVEAGDEELFYTEFEYEDGYISFGSIR